MQSKTRTRDIGVTSDNETYNARRSCLSLASRPVRVSAASLSPTALYLPRPQRPLRRCDGLHLRVEARGPVGAPPQVHLLSRTCHGVEPPADHVTRVRVRRAMEARVVDVQGVAADLVVVDIEI